jgi:hypothetical protein
MVRVRVFAVDSSYRRLRQSFKARLVEKCNDFLGLEIAMRKAGALSSREMDAILKKVSPPRSGFGCSGVRIDDFDACAGRLAARGIQFRSRNEGPDSWLRWFNIVDKDRPF